MNLTPEQLLKTMAAAYQTPAERKFRRQLTMPVNAHMMLALYRLRMGKTVWRDELGNWGTRLVAMDLCLTAPAKERGANGQPRRYMRLTSKGEALADEVVALAERAAAKMNAAKS